MKAAAPSATRRRILLFGTVALVLFASPPVADPQQPTGIRRIVELNPAAGPQEQQRVFRQALRELGYIQGENILTEDRFEAGSEERLREYVAEAVRLKVDVIFAISSSAIRVSANATKTIPSLDSISNQTRLPATSSLASPDPAAPRQQLAWPPARMLPVNLHEGGGHHRVDALRAVMLSPAPLRQPRRPGRLVPSEPLVAGPAADAIAPTQFRHGVQPTFGLRHESHPLFHGFRLRPGHVHLPVNTLGGVTHVPGLICYLCTQFVPSHSLAAAAQRERWTARRHRSETELGVDETVDA